MTTLGSPTNSESRSTNALRQVKIRSTDQYKIPYATGSVTAIDSTWPLVKESHPYAICSAGRQGLRGSKIPITDQLFLSKVPEFPFTRRDVTIWAGSQIVYARCSCAPADVPMRPLLEHQKIPGRKLEADLGPQCPAIWVVSNKGVVTDGNRAYGN